MATTTPSSLCAVSSAEILEFRNIVGKLDAILCLESISLGSIKSRTDRFIHIELDKSLDPVCGPDIWRVYLSKCFGLIKGAKVLEVYTQPRTFEAVRYQVFREGEWLQYVDALCKKLEEKDAIKQEERKSRDEKRYRGLRSKRDPIDDKKHFAKAFKD